MSIRTILTVAALAAGAAACSTMPSPGYAPPASAAFDANAFGWSTRQGQAAIDGRVTYRRDGTIYGCTGSVAVTPETPYTRARFRTLYGSTDAAAVPEAVVRARTVADPNADYRSFVRAGTCADNRFSVTGLPDGGWFVIVPVSAGGDDRVVLMRRIETRGGRTITVTM
jgi:hypothetical protein